MTSHSVRTSTELRGDLLWRNSFDLARDAAGRYGEALAVIDGDVRITFADLPRLAEQAASALSALGLRAGGRVILWAPNSWKWIVLALAIHRLGGLVVPVNTRFRATDLAYVIRKVNPHAIMLEQGFLDADYLGMLDEATNGMARPTTILANESPDPRGLTWPDFIYSGKSTSLPAGDEPAGNQPADIIFTSGTTGQPRGVVATHAQVLRSFYDFGRYCDLRAGDRYAIVNPFSHSFGYRSGWIMALMFGATVWPLATFDVPGLVRLIERERITVLPGTPTLYQSLLTWPGLEGRDLSSLRLSWTGAMNIPPSLIEAMRTRLGFQDILTAYALTEATAVATLTRRGDADLVIASTSGCALPDIEVRIAENDQPLPADESGEIQIRGYNVMDCYLDDPEATAEAVSPDGWLRTGDIGALDAQGYLSVSGRLKDMLIVGGFNVYPAEVEAVLLQHPAIADATVIGVPDERMGEVALAFVILRAGALPDEKGLIAWLRERIANFKVPRQIRFVEELPRNSLGKVLKNELRAKSAVTDA